MVVGIIGLGRMGSIFAQKIAEEQTPVRTGKEKSDGIVKLYTVFGYDIIPPKYLSSQNSITVVSKLSQLVSQVDICIVCVKPNKTTEIISEITNLDKNMMIVSIAAGVSLLQMEKASKKPYPIVRAMPNIAFQNSQSITCFITNRLVTRKQKEDCIALLKTGGEVLEIQNEDLFHTVTAISGSGPAFVFLFMQAMEDVGVSLGLDREQARLLANQTVLGSSSISQKKQDCSYQELIKEVTSPAGTTIHGLLELKKQNFESAIHKAIKKAVHRSKEIEKQIK